MGASGNPAKRAENKIKPKLEVTATEEWLEAAEGEPTELPSGKVVRIITPGMQELVSEDVIPNSLMPIVLGATQGVGTTKEDEAKLRANPQVLLDMMTTMDKVFTICVTEPVFQLPPENKEDRKSGVLYVDRVQQSDKAFVFQLAVGGTADLEQFRREQKAVVERV